MLIYLKNRQFVKTMSFIALSLGLVGCESKKDPVKGSRESLLLTDMSVAPDTSIYGSAVNVGPSVTLTDWKQVGYSPEHAVPVTRLKTDLRLAWKMSVGQGSSEGQRLLSPPVADQSRIYTIDAGSSVSAFGQKEGQRIWQVSLSPKEDGGLSANGGGLAIDGHILFATTCYGEVVALSTKDGKVLWSQKLGTLSRSAPCISDGRIFVTSVNNTTTCLSAKDGKVLWTHTGSPEQTILLGGSTPAVSSGTVIVSYSSGEVHALRTDNGAPVWTDTLLSTARYDSVSSIPHIIAPPVIEGGRVYILSHGGKMAVNDLRSGTRLAQYDMTGVTPVAIGGDNVFVMTKSNQAVCIQKSSGRIRWAVQFPKLYNVLDPGFGLEKVNDAVQWTNPVVLDNSLLLASSNGEILFLHIQNGMKQKVIKTPSSFQLSPVVINGTLFLLNENGDLEAYR